MPHLEALSQRDIPGASANVGRAFIVAIFNRSRDEWWLLVGEIVDSKGDRGVIQPCAPSEWVIFRSP